MNNDKILTIITHYPLFITHYPLLNHLVSAEPFRLSGLCNHKGYTGTWRAATNGANQYHCLIGITPIAVVHPNGVGLACGRVRKRVHKNAISRNRFGGTRQRGCCVEGTTQRVLVRISRPEVTQYQLSVGQR